MANTWSGRLEKLDDFRWRIPRSYRSDMRTDGIVFGSAKIVEEMRGDEAMEQLANVCCLPGIVGSALAMPDAHLGYGFPIGGVAAMDAKAGVVSPGGVGYDINCGVRLMRTELREAEVHARISALADALYAAVPSGIGSSGHLKVSASDLEDVAVDGAQWALQKGFGEAADLAHAEEEGRIDGADPAGLTQHAIDRGRPQLGTLGAGNHFLEVQVIDEIYRPAAASAFGIDEVGQVVVMVHTGSRGFGYQVCDDALRDMQRAATRYGIELPDRQLVCVPIQSDDGRTYLRHMRCAANYAWANRQFISHRIREAFCQTFRRSSDSLGLRLVYDVAHNIAKFETHIVDGEEREVCVHRKGATRAFPANHAEVPDVYREVGQPVLVPGDMGTNSYLLVGTETAMRCSFGSACHGAGRRLSRKRALKESQGRDLVKELGAAGVTVRAQSERTLAEEAPYAYKDVSDVVNSCEGAQIALRVARMRPVAVVKG